MGGGRSNPAVRRPQARGEERRTAIAAAALVVIEREGLDGVTHRTVAAEAGVPLGATTYYFASKEDLMVAAMELLIEREAASLRALGDAVVEQQLTVDEGIAALIEYHAWLWREQRLAQIAQLELFLRVARSGQESGSWIAPYLEVAREVLERLGSSEPETDAQTIVALINGLGLHQLTAPQPLFEERVLRPALRAWAAGTLGAERTG